LLPPVAITQLAVFSTLQLGHLLLASNIRDSHVTAKSRERKHLGLYFDPSTQLASSVAKASPNSLQ
jgi:hypothetical protein